METKPMEYFLNVFIEFAEFSDKNIESATAYVRDEGATTAPARHMPETGSLNCAQFMI